MLGSPRRPLCGLPGRIGRWAQAVASVARGLASLQEGRRSRPNGCCPLLGTQNQIRVIRPEREAKNLRNLVWFTGRVWLAGVWGSPENAGRKRRVSLSWRLRKETSFFLPDVAYLSRHRVLLTVIRSWPQAVWVQRAAHHNRLPACPRASTDARDADVPVVASARLASSLEVTQGD